MSQINAMRQALEALDNYLYAEARVALRQAIEQAEAAVPVAEIIECEINGQQGIREIEGRWKFLRYGTKLYLHPPTAPAHQCKGIPRKGCNYLNACDTVCNKCGEVHKHHQMVAGFNAPTAPAQPDECKDGCPTQQICDYCQGTGGKDKAPAQPMSLEDSLSVIKVCCGDYANCHRPCTPRGRWQATPAQQPLSDEKIMDAFCHTPSIYQFVQAYKAGVKFAEHHHGIKGASL